MVKRIVVFGFAAASFGLASWQFGNSLADSHYRLALDSVDACYLGRGIDPGRTDSIPPAIVQECTQGWRAYESGHLRRALLSLLVGALAALVFLALFATAARLSSPRNHRPGAAS